MFCQKCGSEISEESNFCTKCGSQISKPHTSPWMFGEDLQQRPSAESIRHDQSKVEMNMPTYQPQPVNTPQQSIQKRQTTSKWLIPVIIMATLVIVATILYATANKCDNCDDYFWGEPHNFWGYDVCDDCWH